MTQITSFKIRNSSDSEIEIIHEPECFTYNLPINEEASVKTNACLNSIQLNVTSENGKIIISILDENSYYYVLHNDQNVFKKYLLD